MSTNMSDATPKSERHDRFGRLYWSIDFFHNDNLTEKQHRSNNDFKRPIVGTLRIGNSEFKVTSKELERIHETVLNAQREADMAYRLGLLK